MFLFVGVLAFFSSNDDIKNSSKRNEFFEEHEKNIVHKNISSRNDDYHFEETESFFDAAGNEHILNEDFYCEDCDDFHDDY